MKGFLPRVLLLTPIVLLVCQILPQVVYMSVIVQILFGWIMGCGCILLAAVWAWKANK